MVLRSILILVFFLIGVVHGDFPEDPKRCKYGESKCILNAVNLILRERSEVGDKSLDLGRFDPFPVDKLIVGKGGEGPIAIDLTFTNNKIYGLKTMQAKSIKGFGKDLTQQHELQFHMDAVTFAGPYTVNGKILILPVTGKGISNITLINPVLSIRFKGKNIERNGESYMQPIDFEVDAKPTRASFYFENLFNGDKALGDNMNLFINENWKIIYDELKPDFQRGLGNKFKEVMTKIFAKYPYAKFFQE